MPLHRPPFVPSAPGSPRLCSTGGQVKQVKLSPARRAELQAVNSSVNARIKERSDASAGSADDWRVPTKEGDCEDFAILKKSELMKRGWPASALSADGRDAWRSGTHGAYRSHRQGRPDPRQSQRRRQELVADLLSLLCPPIPVAKRQVDADQLLRQFQEKRTAVPSGIAQKQVFIAIWQFKS